MKFGLPETALGLGTYMVVLDLVWSGEAVRLGLLTSELGRVIDVTADDIKPVPDFGTRIQSEYLRGVGQIEGRFVLFLDTERLLSPAELLRITTIDDSQRRRQTRSKHDAPSGGECRRGLRTGDAGARRSRHGSCAVGDRDQRRRVRALPVADLPRGRASI